MSCPPLVNIPLISLEDGRFPLSKLTSDSLNVAERGCEPTEKSTEPRRDDTLNWFQEGLGM